MNEQNELFSWNNIYEKAMDASFGDPELKADSGGIEEFDYIP